MAGYHATVLGLDVEGLPRLAVRPDAVVVIDDGEGFNVLQGFPGGRGRWRSICVGAPRGSAMCEFALSARPLKLVKPPGPPTLTVGFVQNLLSTKRIASYCQPSQAPIMLPTLFSVHRDSSAVGGGLLDCGTSAPPWFQGQSASFRMPLAPGAPVPPSMVNAFDNPRWSIPLSLSLPNGPTGDLKRMEMADHFRLYAVACDGRRYYPIAHTEWGTDITLTINPGQTFQPGQLPTNSLTGRKVWADAQWQTMGHTQPIVTGQQANQVLVDRLRMEG